MIYPDNFESKIGFDEIRTLLRERCLSTLGKEMVDIYPFPMILKPSTNGCDK